MTCSSCGKNKNELTPQKSKLSSATTLYLCNECIAEKREPRYLIILHGRANGFESVSEYIKRRRYVGKEILAQEFV